MKPKIVEGTFGTCNEYIHLVSASPHDCSGVNIAEYKFELRTSFKYSDGTSIWAEYECPKSSSKDAPSCMIPMAKLARHPYGLKDNEAIIGRVTARSSAGPSLTGICQPESDVSLRLPPNPI